MEKIQKTDPNTSTHFVFFLNESFTELNRRKCRIKHSKIWVHYQFPSQLGGLYCQFLFRKEIDLPGPMSYLQENPDTWFT